MDHFYYLQLETQKLEEIHSILRQYPMSKFENKELTHEEYNDFWKSVFILLEGIKLHEHRVLTNHLASISKAWNNIKVSESQFDPFHTTVDTTVSTVVSTVVDTLVPTVSETHPLYNNHPISKNKLRIRNH
jgi:hypothetical protein